MRATNHKATAWSDGDWLAHNVDHSVWFSACERSCSIYANIANASEQTVTVVVVFDSIVYDFRNRFYEWLNAVWFKANSWTLTIKCKSLIVIVVNKINMHKMLQSNGKFTVHSSNNAFDAFKCDAFLLNFFTFLLISVKYQQIIHQLALVSDGSSHVAHKLERIRNPTSASL